MLGSLIMASSNEGALELYCLHAYMRIFTCGERYITSSTPQDCQVVK